MLTGPALFVCFVTFEAHEMHAIHSLRYYTVHSGKWHAGGSCTANIPINRGFNKSIGYLSGEEDHYTQQVGNAVDLFEDTAPAFGKNGT